NTATRIRRTELMVTPDSEKIQPSGSRLCGGRWGSQDCLIAGRTLELPNTNEHESNRCTSRGVAQRAVFFRFFREFREGLFRIGKQKLDRTRRRERLRTGADVADGAEAADRPPSARSAAVPLVQSRRVRLPARSRNSPKIPFLKNG